MHMCTTHTTSLQHATRAQETWCSKRIQPLSARHARTHWRGLRWAAVDRVPQLSVDSDYVGLRLIIHIHFLVESVRESRVNGKHRRARSEAQRNAASAAAAAPPPTRGHTAHAPSRRIIVNRRRNPHFRELREPRQCKIWVGSVVLRVRPRVRRLRALQPAVRRLERCVREALLLWQLVLNVLNVLCRKVRLRARGRSVEK